MVVLFFCFNLKESHLPATQKTGVLSEKLVPVLAEQVSLVCVRSGLSKLGVSSEKVWESGLLQI